MEGQPALVVDRGEGPDVSEAHEHGALTFGEWDRRSDALAPSWRPAAMMPPCTTLEKPR
jgi:hypothetical protein